MIAATAVAGSSVRMRRSRSSWPIMPLLEHRVAQPVDEALPVRDAHQHDRELGHLARLRQRHRLEELVERAEAAGQHDEAVGVLEEHHLAREEVAEVDAEVDVLVEAGLEGQLDAEPHRRAARPRRRRGWPPPSRPGPPPVMTAKPASTSLRPTSTPMAYAGSLGRVRADPKTATAGPSSESEPKPSTNSDWMRSTRHGSACSQSTSGRALQQPLVGRRRGHPVAAQGHRAGLAPRSRLGLRRRPRACSSVTASPYASALGSTAVATRPAVRPASAAGRPRRRCTARRGSSRRPCGRGWGRPGRS